MKMNTILLNTSTRRLPIDVRFDLAVSRMRILEQSLQATNCFLERDRYASILDDLGEAYREVMRIAELMEVDEEIVVEVEV